MELVAVVPTFWGVTIFHRRTFQANFSHVSQGVHKPEVYCTTCNNLV